MTDGPPLFKACVRLRPNGERVPGSEPAQYGWEHSLPCVERHDLHTAWLIRTDRGVRDQYERWLRS